MAVDHVVALAVAWDFGAHQWSAQQRRNLANDPRNLLVTTASTNAAKADRTPWLWHPATAAGRCRFAQMYIEVLSVYGLPVTVDDRAALMEDLDACQ